MSVRSLFVALLGVVVAGGSAYGAREYLVVPAATGDKAAAELASIVVATQDIPFGVPITAQMLSYQPWPVAALPSGAFTRMDDLVQSKGEPRRAKFAVAAGMPVLEAGVSGFGEKVTLVQNLGPNARAMAISVDATTAVGGFVTPGDRVDVLLTQGDGETLRSVTILQDIRVLGVDQDSDVQTDAPAVARTVTVEVSPEDSQKLALAQKAGTLSLALRTLDQVQNADLEYTTLADLIQVKPEPVVVAPAPAPALEPAPRRTVTVRKGNTEISVVDVN